MPTTSKLLLPRPSLSGCVVAGVYRDTRGAGLSATDRVNHFPAAPIVTLTCVLEGKLYLLPGQDTLKPITARPLAKGCALPRIFVMGPQMSPLSSWSPGAVVALTVGFYPDAWLAMGGAHNWTGIPTIIFEAAQAIGADNAPTAGWQRFCDSLQAEWIECRPRNWHRASNLADWSRAIATRAALSGSGRSLRSIERRFKRYSGQSRRTLDFFAAFEQLQRTSLEGSDRSLATIAIEAGYSDQSHMGRAVRRATGFSPARLNKAIECEEPFWCYRLLGERF